MKKRIVIAAGLLMSVLCLSSCKAKINNDTTETSEMLAIYELYKENGGTLTYEE